MKTIKGIIFDMDGTLIDSEREAIKIYQELTKDSAIPFDVQDYLENCSGKSLDNGVNYMLKHYNLPWSFEEARQRVIDLVEISKLNIPLKEGAKELLNYLKENNYKTVLATSSWRSRAEDILNNHDILKYFDHLVCQDDLTRGKPDPEVFLKANEKLKLSKEECLIIEDSDSGVLAGFKSGIKTICIPDCKKPNKETLQYSFRVLNSLIEMIDLLKNED